MTLAAYNGSEALTFSDYVNLETGRTLHAEPGKVYEVAPASGRPVPDVPEGWFTPVQFAKGGVVTASAAIAGESALDDEPETSSEDEDREPEVSREF